jgi:histidine phosphotransfer protein HptB
MNPDNASSARPVARLDPTALARLRELDPDGRHGVLARVLEAFETSLSRMLAQLQAEAGEAGNPGVVSSVAHTLKSSSASVGALSLASACADVEARWRQGGGDPATLRTDVQRLLMEGQSALAAVGAMLRP